MERQITLSCQGKNLLKIRKISIAISDKINSCLLTLCLLMAFFLAPSIFQSLLENLISMVENETSSVFSTFSTQRNT